MQQRPSSRLLIFNPCCEVLLFRFVFLEGALKGSDFWSTPGGGLERNETFEQAAKRELYEETGLVLDVGEQIGQRTAVFQLPNGEHVEADERYFYFKTFNNEVDKANRSLQELDVIKEHYWWSRTELLETEKTVFPENILGLIDNIPNKVDKMK